MTTTAGSFHTLLNSRVFVSAAAVQTLPGGSPNRVTMHCVEFNLPLVSLVCHILWSDNLFYLIFFRFLATEMLNNDLGVVF